MAVGTRFVSPYFIWPDPTGEPIPGALLFFYLTTSSTPAPTYSDVGLTIPNTNPVLADDTGMFPNIFLDPTITYKAILSYPSDGINPPVQVWIADPYEQGAATPTPSATPVQVNTIAAFTTALIPGGTVMVQVLGYYAVGDGGGGNYIPAAAGAGAGKVQSGDGAWWILTAQIANVRQFGAKLDGATEDSPAWTAALSWAKAHGNVPVYHPGGNSIFTGNMVLDNHTLLGVDSYYDPPGAAITQTSLVTFHGAGGGITLASATSGGVTLEKIGFKGVPATYASQVGFFMDDALRPAGQNEGWPTFRDVSFGAFAFGINVGEKYQSGWMWNVYCYDCTSVGYWNQSTDWYHHGISCGSSSVVASDAQLVLGPNATSAFSAGAHQFIGGAFFGGNNAVIIQNCGECVIIGAAIQNGQTNGLAFTGTSVNSHTIAECLFSGNNINGGARNVNGTSNFDIWLNNNAREIRIYNNRFAAFGAGTACVAAGIGIVGPNADGLIASGNLFNMDEIVTPGAPAAPLAIQVPASILLNLIDHLQINDNLASYGEGGVYPFEQRNVDMVSIAGATTIASTFLSIKAGSAYIGAAVTDFLRDPAYAGRLMTICGANGAGFACATAGALGGGHHQGAFTAAGGYVQMISTSATTWQILGSANVTIS